jgi:hypothetical protein
VHLFGFIIKKFVMMHGHMNVKKKKAVTQFTTTTGSQAITALEEIPTSSSLISCLG